MPSSSCKPASKQCAAPAFAIPALIIHARALAFASRSALSSCATWEKVRLRATAVAAERHFATLEGICRCARMRDACSEAEAAGCHGMCFLCSGHAERCCPRCRTRTCDASRPARRRRWRLTPRDRRVRGSGGSARMRIDGAMHTHNRRASQPAWQRSESPPPVPVPEPAALPRPRFPGAYGTVWKCLDKDTNQMVAMKRFKEVRGRALGLRASRAGLTGGREGTFW
eukprot:15807-Chlamydomonas_euryale.AAC.5